MKHPDTAHDPEPQAWRQAQDPGPEPEPEPKRKLSLAEQFARANGYEGRPLEPKRKRKSVRREPLTQADVAAIKELRAQGHAYRVIAAETGKPLATVGWILNEKRTAQTAVVE